MANIKEVSSTENNKSNEINDTEKLLSKFKKYSIGFIALCIVAIVFFVWQQWKTFSCAEPILNDVFGTFGDFVGGFIGTLIALYTAYLLVHTLSNQIDTNRSVKKTNDNVIKTNESVIKTNEKLISQTELQIFDNRFSTLLDLYKNAIESYDGENEIKGRSVFEHIVDEFKTKGLDNKTEYKRRAIVASSEYNKLYVQNRKNFSVHFRVLYLLSKLTAEEKMHEEYKVSYAKTIRGQLSDGEMLILRYNCFLPYGKKMRTYVNKFNLIKHLPITNLLEFTSWRDLLNSDNNNDYAKTNCSAIDQLTITLKKIMTELLDEEGATHHEYKISSRLALTFQLNEEHDRFDIDFKIHKKKKKGGAIPRPIEEHAFDRILDTDKNKLPLFFKEIFSEIFIYSNFCLFNGDDYNIIKTKVSDETDEKMEIEIIIERDGNPLALADRQVRPS